MDMDAKWNAILSRDARADGYFVYAVRTTGIYCRPSCASRKPKKENVIFFDLPEVAEARGFRSCLRCSPRDASYDPRLDRIRNVIKYIEEHMDESPSLKELGRSVGMSPHHLQRTFKRVVGVSPHKYLESLRMRKYKHLLKNGSDLADACYEAGYGSSSRVYERTPDHLGMTPLTYQKGAAGVSIRYGLTKCRLGWLLVAVTDKGVCRVSIGESEGELVLDLEKEFPRANLQRSDAGLRQHLEVVAGLAEGRTPSESLPLDVRATAFQSRVWERLRSISFGNTMTYKEIAEEMGLEKGARAVGRACAENPVALLVPCHRVVREDGGLAGYRWGLERKKELLDMERNMKKTRRAKTPPA